ncbi:MAG: methylated-DNA--protein-cysteine methyltransferase [Fimbriimonadales bacterium]|nr:MAG: methylated-DNA--protein-cysteine methyltransferase [Fimbriimonadales bacterium]
MPNGADGVYALVRAIPRGKVVSYGQIAVCCSPLTARQVGRIMASALEDDIPWWRVVGSDGSLRIYKRDPMLAQLQRTYLQGEGVQFTSDGRVQMTSEQVAAPETFEVQLE